MQGKQIWAIVVVAILAVAAVGFIILSPSNEAGDLKITIVAQANSEGSGIFVLDEVTDETDLGGRIFATPGTSSIQHMMFMDYVVDLGYSFAIAPSSGTLNSNTVYWTTVAPAQMKDAISGNLELSGGIAWEPYVSAIISDSATGCKILKWSSELWEDHPCCVLAANTQFMEDNPEVVQSFVAAHALATQWMVDTLAEGAGANYTRLVNISTAFAFGPDSGMEDVTEAALLQVKYDFHMPGAWLSSLEQVLETYEDLGLLNEGAMEHWGFSNHTQAVDTLVNGSFVDNVTGVSIVDANASLATVRLGWLYGDIHQIARLVAMDLSIGQGMGFGDRTIYQAYGLNVVGGGGNPYANGGSVMDAFFADVIDIGFLGSPPAILRSINQF